VLHFATTIRNFAPLSTGDPHSSRLTNVLDCEIDCVRSRDFRLRGPDKPARSELEPCALSLEWAVHCAEIWAALPATSNCPAHKTEAV